MKKLKNVLFLMLLSLTTTTVFSMEQDQSDEAINLRQAPSFAEATEDRQDEKRKTIKVIAEAIQEESKTPLIEAYKFGNIDILLYLLENFDCDFYQKDEEEKTILHYLCKDGDIELVTFIVELAIELESEIIVDQVDLEKRTPLYYAFVNKHEEVCKYLLEIGASIKQQIKNPLIEAYKLGAMEILEYLLKKQDYDINEQDKDGKTLLHYACEKEDLKTIKLVVESQPEININAKNNKMKTPLYYAFENNYKEIFQYLMDKGAKYKDFAYNNKFIICSCPVCLEEFKDFEDISTTHCEHAFHTHCLSQCLETRKTCPMCNQAVLVLYRKMYKEPSVEDIIKRRNLIAQTIESILKNESKIYKKTKKLLAEEKNSNNTQDEDKKIRAFQKKIRSLNSIIKENPEATIKHLIEMGYSKTLINQISTSKIKVLKKIIRSKQDMTNEQLSQQGFQLHNIQKARKIIEGEKRVESIKKLLDENLFMKKEELISSGYQNEEIESVLFEHKTKMVHEREKINAMTNVEQTEKIITILTQNPDIENTKLTSNLGYRVQNIAKARFALLTRKYEKKVKPIKEILYQNPSKGEDQLVTMG